MKTGALAGHFRGVLAWNIHPLAPSIADMEKYYRFQWLNPCLRTYIRTAGACRKQFKQFFVNIKHQKT